ncbi:hypothetical protein, variant [Aphanomyces invadans]|uniref:Endonuclease/exonuclease/phosphatase domain-containing protein n=1 Tax=Aphanomyces invadans TaxID=157072 RepID=A0A024TDQ3_9STRA|nr:hypothetical protein, variant [Aphanomyces invadans]ETV92144.1 hypothetical protein, variant [Aphanomyces invadans]|eukprot:XP_008879108.1 hypothetical protein, variant [Aphanomyces invadans]
MGLGKTLRDIKRRVAMELFEADVDENVAPSFVISKVHEPNAPKSIRVLSMNVWGIPVSPHVLERAAAIGRMLEARSTEFDIVTLQEVWHRREKNIILCAATRAGFGYSHYFHPAVGFPLPIGHDSFGTGLLILSKYRLSAAMYHPFLLTGRPYALHEADFIANKGVGLLRVHDGKGGEIADLYVTHLLANYNHLGKPGPGDTYMPHRAAQSYELSCFISETSRNDLVIVCGDFNSPSDCLVLDIVRELVSMRDAFHENDPTEAGLTFGTEDNKFSHGDHPMRMDYILFRTAAGSSWQLTDSGVFKGYFTTSCGEECPLSDHFGVHAAFALDPSTAPPTARSTSSNPIKCLRQVQDILTLGRNEIVALRITHLKRAAVGFIFVALATAVNVSQWGEVWSVWSRVLWYSGLTLCFLYALVERFVSPCMHLTLKKMLSSGEKTCAHLPEADATTLP